MQAANASPASQPSEVVERVQKTASALGCAGVWVRATGPYILLGFSGGDPFARLTALGGASYGLAFRAPSPKAKGPAIWDPVLLIDELADVVEHALVGVSALPLTG